MPVELFEMPLSAPCRAVKVLAKRIGLDLKLTPVNLMEKAQLEPDYLKMNPFHTVPTMNDDGFYLCESRAIMVYLVSKYAPESDLYPKDLKQRALVDAMLNVDIGTLSSALLRRLRTIILMGHDSPDVFLEKGKENLKCLDNLLETHKYAAGDHLTLADISIVHTLGIADVLDDDLSEFVNLTEYRSRVGQELGEYFLEQDSSSIEQIKGFLKSKRTA